MTDITSIMTKFLFLYNDVMISIFLSSSLSISLFRVLLSFLVSVLRL